MGEALKSAKVRHSEGEAERMKDAELAEHYLQQNPHDANVWFELASCYDSLGKEAQAEPCYRQVYNLGITQFSPQDQQVFFVGFGSTLRNNKKFLESEQILREGVLRFPNYVALKIFLAFTLYNLEKYLEASEFLFQACGDPAASLDGYEKAIRLYSDKIRDWP